MSFDSIAPHYRWLETIAFANKLQSARVAFLDQIGAPKRALIVGEGNGRFLSAFLNKYPGTEVDCVDASARMLELARTRACSSLRVRFFREDILAWGAEENTYDLIVTHFFLDCFQESELEMVVAKLARSATKNATWLLADFSIPSRGLARIHAQLWLRAMYLFFRLTTHISGHRLINPSQYLIAHGFHPATCRFAQLGLIKSELWQRASRSGGRAREHFRSLQAAE